MNATILLDEVQLPETGPAEIAVKRSFVIHVSAQQAQRSVNRWLRDAVSMSFIAESPTLALGAQIVWRIPIAYTASHVGRVGLAGFVDVDVLTGELLNTENVRDNLFTTARPMAEKLPPFHVREVADEYLVTDLQPTHTRPESTPLAVIADGHN